MDLSPRMEYWGLVCWIIGVVVGFFVGKTVALYYRAHLCNRCLAKEGNPHEITCDECGRESLGYCVITAD
jgi:hypothetical protein